MRLFLIYMFVGSILFAPKALADTNCLPMYGGGDNCVGNITIQKSVVNPVTNTDVHDLGITDPQFVPGQKVTFHIKVTNTGNATINNSSIVDLFPQFLTFVSGPGSFNKNNSQLSFQVNNLLPNTSQVFTITGTVVDASQITSTDGVCVSNEATVTTPTNESAQDSSQFCIQKANAVTANIAPVVTNSPTIIPPTSTPATGPNTLYLLGLLGMGGIGFFLQNKSKAKNI